MLSIYHSYAIKVGHSTNHLHKVYGIILMEQSPGEFHKAAGHYIHKRKPVFDTGIYRDNPGLHEDIFLCLDSFHSNVHNITKDCSELEAWLTFLSATDPVVIGMLSKELYIMDKNMERLMVSQLQEEVTAEKARADAAEVKASEAVTKMEIFKLKCQSKTPTEIADKLGLSVEYVDSVLNEP